MSDASKITAWIVTAIVTLAALFLTKDLECLGLFFIPFVVEFFDRLINQAKINFLSEVVK